jgi:hypothetical protein
VKDAYLKEETIERMGGKKGRYTHERDRKELKRMRMREGRVDE